MTTARSMLLAYPFRIFFPCAALFGALAIIAWVAALAGSIALPAGLNPLLWHSHEMLYGFGAAAVAGFLLTAMSNWTGVPPPTGARLLAFVLLWLAGRLAMAFAGVLPGWLVVLVDLAFLPALAGYVFAVLYRAGNTRNLPMVAMLGLLALGNLLMHLALTGVMPRLGHPGELIALDTIALLMGVIGGRITPAFTRNWLTQRGGDPTGVRVRPRLDQAALLATALMLPADLVAPGSMGAAAVALTAGLLLMLRVLGWRGWRVWRDPLMWILHVGYAWLALALILKGLVPLLPALNPSVWYHALGVGAMGTLIAGVMTRVAVGHTGRPMALLRGGQLIYWLVIAAAILRLATSMGGSAWTLHTAAAAWAAAFLLFTVLYGPLLNRPRVDGRSG